MSLPRVTVAVLNYNYARFLGAAIDSALAQTHRDVEVVVVDDGSTDSSGEVIDSYGDRVTAVRKPNGGQGSAMNAAFAVSSGDVVCFLDADDLLAPEAAATVGAAFRDDRDAAWVMFRLGVIDESGAPTGRVRPRRPGVMPSGDLRRHVASYRCFHWQPTSGNAFAASALRRVLPIPEDAYRISADAYLASVVPLCGPVRSTDAVLGSYRIHGRSNFTSARVDERYFRGQIDRLVTSHAHAVRVGERLGVPLPDDPTAPRDAAFLGFRIASLLLDPRGHPFPDDRRGRLVLDGVLAAVRNPQLRWPNRLRRAAFFLACALPGPLGVRAARAAPDTPARRARRAAAMEG